MRRKMAVFFGALCRLQSETRKRVGSRPAYVQRVSDKHKTTITNHLLSLFFGTDVHNDTLTKKKPSVRKNTRFQPVEKPGLPI